VFSAMDGALWRTDVGGRALLLRSGGARIHRMVTLPDQRTVYAGYENGDVIAIDTKSWQQQPILHAAGAVQEIAITGDGRTAAIATSDGTIHVGTLHGSASNPTGIIWARFAARVRDLTLTPDGLLIAAGTDGTIWLYSPSRHRWLCLPTCTVDLAWTAITADGHAAAAVDLEGRLIWIDLDAARKQLST
jgi:WD40 repeat protein